MGCSSAPAVPVNWVSSRVMKKVEDVGICVARILAIDVGFSANGLTDAIRPDVRVTVKNVCYREPRTVNLLGYSQ